MYASRGCRKGVRREAFRQALGITGKDESDPSGGSVKGKKGGPLKRRRSVCVRTGRRRVRVIGAIWNTV